jgi:hypothetical protein
MCDADSMSALPLWPAWDNYNLSSYETIFSIIAAPKGYECEGERWHV